MNCAPDLKSPGFFLFLGLFGTTPAAIVPIWCFFFAVQHRLVIAALACLKKKIPGHLTTGYFIGPVPGLSQYLDCYLELEYLGTLCLETGTLEVW